VRTLERIKLAGYKSIRELDLELGSLNVLIGANGAGKSNLISAFELVGNIVQKTLPVYVGRAGGADALLHFGRRVTDSIDIGLSFRGLTPDIFNGYGCSLVPTAEGMLIFADEWCSYHDRRNYPTPRLHDLGSGHATTQLFSQTGKSGYYVARYVVEAMLNWRVYHFHDTSATAPIKGTADLHDNRTLRDDASNLSAYLYLLRERYGDTYERIVRTVQMAAPFFDDFDLKPSELNPEKIRLEWREKGSDAYFNAHALSDGTLRFICLTTLLQMPNPPATILIDEPELGLHPYAITLLAGMLRSAATRTQVIVSTQSVTLVNQFAPEDVIVVDRGDNQSVFSRPDPAGLASWLEEYGVGDLWEKALLGGRPAHPGAS